MVNGERSSGCKCLGYLSESCYEILSEVLDRDLLALSQRLEM